MEHRLAVKLQISVRLALSLGFKIKGFESWLAGFVCVAEVAACVFFERVSGQRICSEISHPVEQTAVQFQPSDARYEL